MKLLSVIIIDTVNIQSIFRKDKEMAQQSSTALKVVLDEQLTCNVCLDQYTNPKTLPCLHSFCLNYIENLPQEPQVQTNKQTNKQTHTHTHTQFDFVNTSLFIHYLIY